MKLNEFDYSLPKELIAQKPIQPRDHSRLMVLNRQKQTIKHDYFYNLGCYLQKGDVLVANNSKVMPARLLGEKETGGKAEILLLRKISDQNWQVLIKNCKIGDKITFSHTQECKDVNLGMERLIGELKDGLGELSFNLRGQKLRRAINNLGQAPTPPYIKRPSNLKEYQTVYAQSEGSVAAPTAGFHFTPQLMSALKKKGVKFEFVTLHIGLGTFQPVRIDDIRKHQMHSEWAELKPAVARRLNLAKQNGQRVIAVGTTSVRILENFCQSDGHLVAGKNWINLFIYPGYNFKFIDALITNFHLPKSTLLMLVSAFAEATADKSAFACPEQGRGACRDFILHAYQEAIKRKYRFYSFGDAMLIL